MTGMYESSETDTPLPETATGERDVSGDMNKVKNDLAQLREDVSELLQSLVESGKSQAQSAGERLSNMTQMRMDQANRAWGKVRESGNRAAQGMQRQIEERPAVVLGLTFATGVLIGRLLSRR